jgi:hypothetical protein
LTRKKEHKNSSYDKSGQSGNSYIILSQDKRRPRILNSEPRQEKNGILLVSELSEVDEKLQIGIT